MDPNYDALLQQRALAGLGEAAEQARAVALRVDGGAADAGVSRDGQVERAGVLGDGRALAEAAVLGEAAEQARALAAASASMVVSPSVHEMVHGEVSEQARALAAAAGAGTGVSQSLHEAAAHGDHRLQDRALALGAGWVPVQGAVPPTSLMRSADEQLEDLIRQQMMADDFLMQNRIATTPPALRSMRIEGGGTNKT